MRKFSLSFGYLILILSILICVFLKPLIEYSPINAFTVNACALLVFINSVSFFRTVSKFVKTWVRFDFFFILSYLIVHFQTVFLYVNFNIQPVKYDFWTNKLTVNYGIWYSSIIVLLWMLGYYFYLSKNLKKINNHKQTNSGYLIKYSVFFDYLILILFGVFGVFVGREFWSGSYLGTANWGAGATYIFLVLRTLITLRVVYFFVNNKNNLSTIRKIRSTLLRNKILLLLVIFYILIFLIQGDRGPVMQLGLLIYGGYSIFAKNISFNKIFILTIIGTFVFTIIGLGRSSESQFRDNDIFTQGLNNFNNSESSIIPTEELAWSGGILYKAIDINRDGTAYLKGVTVFNNVVGIIPLSNIFYSPPKMMKSSTSYFTYLYKGPEAKFGVGSEIIADLYINFGFWPTIFIFIFFGYYISFVTIESHIYKKNIYTLLIYMTLVSLSIYMNRANFLIPLKYVFYLCLFHLFFGKIIKWKQRKSHS